MWRRNQKQPMKNKITLDQARRVLEVVDAGLSHGMGNPIPGQMCVEAAVCYALGQPHGDEPECVNNAVRRFKIRLNDSPWSSKDARAAGMRRLAIAQLGTSDPSFDEKKFVEVLVEQTIRKIVPHALRSAIKGVKDKKHKAAIEEAAVRCERDGDLGAAKNARSAASAAAADAAAADAASAYDAAYIAADAAADAVSAYDAACIAVDAVADAAAYAASASASASAADADANAAYASYADFVARNNIALNMSADIGVEALRAAGAHGIKLMDQLIPA